MVRLILLLCFPILLAGSIDPAVLLPTAVEAPFQQVAVQRGTVGAGQEQSIAVTLDKSTATTTILELTVTYPDGTTQRVLGQTLGTTADIAWQVPPGTAAGMAQFAVETSGCGCGDRGVAAAPIDLESTATGFFYIHP
jgi:hypothetical protein